MKIIFTRNEAWGSVIRTSTHALAEQFLNAGWEGLWLSHALTPWRLFYRSFKSQSRIWLKGGCSSKGMIEYCPLFLAAYVGNRFLSSRFLWKISPNLTVPPLKSFVNKRCFSSPDVLWLAFLSTASVHRIMSPKVIVYHAHDAFALYPNASSKTRTLERDVVTQAHLVVTTAATTAVALKDSYSLPDSKVLHVPHGVDLSRYAQKLSEPPDLVPIPRPRVTVVGTLDLEDPRLLAHTARLMPHVHFVLIGPYGERFRNIIMAGKESNITLLGPKEQRQLPAYLKNCDAGLIAYDPSLRNTRRFGTDPMKRYEYAAAGLPTVSIPLEEYKLSPSPLYIGETPLQLAAGLRECLAPEWDGRQALADFASQASWTSRYAKVESAIQAML